MQIRKILIANRGEIAVRIIRACREMSILTVAVYSEPDRSAPHVLLADQAYPIGPGPAVASYLLIDKILEVARESGADAIHPGYGFLSENAAFARACEEAGVIFIGPTSASIELLGDKIHAKERVSAAGVPIVPGYMGEDQSDARLATEAVSIGTPLLIKAAAGGGGKGMRVVRDLVDFPVNLDEARREAVASFGDNRVLLERYVEAPRHIEVQIVGDKFGDVVHLFERECSIQRRHQKIIEESPSAVLTSALRNEITSAAVTAAKAAHYENAGTVEFLFEERPDGSHKFYFLEVNTRLQVEHSVTEMLTGIDLVKLQIRVASGEPLGFEQSEIIARGQALEVRIYAESPSTGFLPSIGPLDQWIEPVGPGIRVDSGVVQGGQVSPFYDPMLAKLIVYSESREVSIQKMVTALSSFHVMGVETNIAYLMDILNHPLYREGKISTRFLADHFEHYQSSHDLPEEVILAIAADRLSPADQSGGALSNGRPAVYNLWKEQGNWRNFTDVSMTRSENGN